MTYDLSCFKAYDIRGHVPDPLNPALASALGQAVAEVMGARSVVLGRDARLSGPDLRDGLAAGLQAHGVSVTDLGMCGTEEIYHAAARHPYDAGIMITGSHNPADENGFKLVRAGARPVSGDSGLMALRDRVRAVLESGKPLPQKPLQPLLKADYRAAYVAWLLDYSGLAALKNMPPLKIVANAGNGCAGLVLTELLRHPVMQALPVECIVLQAEPDGHFPQGVPNPLLPEKRAFTSRMVRQHKAHLGLAWDGDFDRCFFYDHEGNFIEGYYLIGLLAQALLQRFPAGKVVHDTRVYWNTQDVVRAAGGRPVMGKTGHAFMKERMRAEDAVYGGEMSAHHYFRDFAYCDSGMLPWLLLLRLMAGTGQSLHAMVAARMAAYPCSGEINRRVANAPDLMRRIRDHYAPAADYEDSIDGVNLEFAHWRFNLRMSNTEPLLRLNVESRGDAALTRGKTAELLSWLDASNQNAC